MLTKIGEIWHDLFTFAAWFAAIGFVISGIQDRYHDISLYIWRAYKWLKFRNRQRITLERLRVMEQQSIAVFAPAWSEADVIDKMIGNILERVEYSNYVVFVGTYPNDPDTQAAVDRIVAEHERVVKVVTARPGPTSKADCLNNIYDAMVRYEGENGVNFDIIAMHDAEDFVHPYEFLMFNYLLPRVDAIQIPILPMPTPHHEWIHWCYADEFAMAHMNDIIAREHASGFVPFAGTGMAFSRRALLELKERYGAKLFADGLLTEDYATGKKMHDSGMTVVFVNVILADDDAPWWRPLSQRRFFISNWAYFPKNFQRSVRQKTRWITGIVIQEWQRGGWHGKPLTIENLIKDRKSIVTPYVIFLGYAVVAYWVIAWLGQRGTLPFQWKPIIIGDPVLIALIKTNFVLLLFVCVQRIVVVGRVYGVVAGLLSIPRFVVGNLVNGLASWRALSTWVKTRLFSKQVTWDKTKHEEGLGAMPSAGHATTMAKREASAEWPAAHIAELLLSGDVATVRSGMLAMRPGLSKAEIAMLSERVLARAADHDYRVRAAIAGALLRLGAPVRDTLFKLLRDGEWAVRANTARAMVASAHAEDLVIAAFEVVDRYGREVLLKSLENNGRLMRAVLANDAFAPRVGEITKQSLLMRRRVDRASVTVDELAYIDAPRPEGAS